MKNKTRNKKENIERIYHIIFLMALIILTLLIISYTSKSANKSPWGETVITASTNPEIIREQQEEGNMRINRGVGTCRTGICIGTEGPDVVEPIGRQIKIRTWLGNYDKVTGEHQEGPYSSRENGPQDKTSHYDGEGGGINCYQLSKISLVLHGGADEFIIPCNIITFVWAGDGDDRGVLSASGPLQKSPTKDSKGKPIKAGGKPIPNSNRNKIFGGDGNDNSLVVGAKIGGSTIKGLNGGEAPDMICGGSGEDYIAGYGGDDIIKGEEDKDEIYVNKKGNKGTVKDKAEANAPKDDESNTEIVYGCPGKSGENCNVEELNPPLSPTDIDCAESEPAETTVQGSSGPKLPPVG